MDVIEIRDPEIDQADIHKRIAERIAQRQASGAHDPDLAERGPESLHRNATQDAIDFADLDDDLIDLAANASLREPRFTSSLPVLGGLIVAVRRAWNWMSTRWYVLPLIGQQNAINQKAANIAGRLAYRQELHDRRLAELLARVEELEKRLAHFEER